MSTRYEFIDAATVHVTLLSRDAVEATTGEELDEGQFGLVLGGDEVTILAGSAADLRRAVGRIAACLDRLAAPEVTHGLDWADTGTAYSGRCDCGEWRRTEIDTLDALLALYEVHLRDVGVPDHRKAPSRGECTVCGEPVALTDEWFPTTTHAGAPAVRHARDCLAR